MDVIDSRILAALEADGRASFAELADSVGLSKTPCWNRVQSLEEAHVITGYRAIISPAALGLGVHAYVQVMINSEMRVAFEEAVISNPSILECHTTAGDADYVLKIICRDVHDLDHLLRFELTTLPGVQRSSTTVCLKTVKQLGSVTAAAVPRTRSPTKARDEKRTGR